MAEPIEVPAVWSHGLGRAHRRMVDILNLIL